MACACKVTQDLSYIQQKYGTKGKEQPKTNIRGLAKVYAINTLIALVCLPLLPIFFIYLLFRRKGDPISINKTLHFFMHPFKRNRK